jgi:hypothetical protein
MNRTTTATIQEDLVSIDSTMFGARQRRVEGGKPETEIPGFWGADPIGFLHRERARRTLPCLVEEAREKSVRNLCEGPV